LIVLDIADQLFAYEDGQLTDTETVQRGYVARDGEVLIDLAEDD
jgi:hypothetical protein